MANCKNDCLHSPVCRLPFNKAKIQINFAEECHHFKNKADFVEVKRAKWIYAIDCYRCSVCTGKRFNLLLGTDAEYCPYCGAKMIFEEEGENNG